MRLLNVRFALSALAVVLMSSSVASAQATASLLAPIPGQIVSARRIFISNAGSESYGSERYFHLTRYDGGQDRFYNQLYSAIKDWGRYELTDSPAMADVVYEVRFTNPVIDKETKDTFVYDPQLGVTILDPKTRVALWYLTEHIQPGRDKESDNKNFDSAVDRIVGKAKMLVESPTAARPQAATEIVPVGALETARRETRTKHAAIGTAIGTLAGGLVASREFNVCPMDSGANCSRSRALGTLGYLVSGAVSGALVGWIWPVR
jgi:hypothetical protein